MSITANDIAVVVNVLILIGVGWRVITALNKLSDLPTAFDKHAKKDRRSFKAIRAEMRDLRAEITKRDAA